jgi:hypothetical protein
MILSFRLGLLGGVVLSALALRGADSSPPAPLNSLSEAERAAGWRLLFDGQSTHGWRGFRQPGFPAQGWVVEEGILKKIARVRGGDLVTEATFGDFELAWEWRLPARANSGVKYFILEERAKPIGHEYQMLDDRLAREGKYATAAFYDVLPPSPDKPAPRIGDWNQSRVRVQGAHVEHWLNGVRVLAYELGSDTVLAAVSRSKFKDVPGFGTKVRGHILLTDHGDEAWFRNLKIRELVVK